MNFAVVGAGAVGMLTACLLEEAGSNVQLITRRQSQADLINKQGIKKGQSIHKVNSSASLDQVQPNAYILICVKYGDLQGVVETLKHKCLKNPLVFLQNGMLHLQQIKYLEQQDISVGIIEHGALKISDNEVRHTGRGIFKFALLRGEKERFLPLMGINGVKCEWYENADQMLFRKVLLNSMINPLTALMSIPNGELLSNPYAYELLRNLYTELYSAFPEIENLLPFEEVTALCASTSANTSSMLADKLAGRKMELDTILLYTLERARCELPLLRTFYHLLKAAEVDE